MTKKRSNGPGGARPGAGRPRQLDTRSVVWTLKLMPSMAEDFDRLAEGLSMTRAAALLEAISAFMAKEKRRRPWPVPTAAT